MRAELRSPDAQADPYLAFALLIYAGLHGIRERLPLPQPVDADLFSDAEAARMREIYDERRRFLLDALPKLGFRIPVEPRGAFYMLINARHLGADSRTLAFDLLEKAHIGVTPGIDFGSQTEGFLRLSYANSLENLREAMRRLEQYIRTA